MPKSKVKNDLIRRFFGSKKNLLILWPFLILIAKVIRYTILKESLVDTGIGHRILQQILTQTTDFQLFESGSVTDTTGNAAFFFQHLNLFGLGDYASFEIYVTIIWNFIIALLFIKCKNRFNSLQSIFLIISILALNIFDFTMAKEPIQILYFIILYYIIESKSIDNKMKWILSTIVIIVSAITFRTYYILMIAWALVLLGLYRFSLLKKINWKTITLLVVAVITVYYVMLLFVKTVSVGSYLELIRVRTREGDAVTQINAMFGSNNTILFSVNYVLTVIRLLFPIELIRFGIKYIIYVGVQIIFSWVYLKSLFSINYLNKSERIALFLFSGFILMSAFFEPDFGSWIRHEAAAFPLMLILSGITYISDSLRFRRNSLSRH